MDDDDDAVAATSPRPPDPYFSRTFWKYEVILLVFGLGAAPLTWFSDASRLMREGEKAEVRVIERRDDGEYLVVYNDAIFTVQSDNEEFDAEDRFDVFLDPGNPEFNSDVNDAVFDVMFGLVICLLPIAYPLGRWLNRRRSARRRLRVEGAG
jgi:hypothetical protein